MLVLREFCGKCQLSSCKSSGEASSFRAQSITGGGERLKWGGGKHQPKGIWCLRRDREVPHPGLVFVRKIRSWPVPTEARGWDAKRRITRVNIYSCA